MKFGFHNCYNKYYNTIGLALMAVREISHVKENVPKDMENELKNDLKQLVELMPRNCENPGHFGACLTWCDCGCMKNIKCKGS